MFKDFGFKPAVGIAMVLLFAASLALTSCGDPQREIHVYGRFQDAYTEDALEIDCGWDGVRTFLDNRDPREFGIYQVDSFSSSDGYIGKYNQIRFTSYPTEQPDASLADPGSCQVSYGAILCNSAQERQGVGDRYFSEPMIEIYLHNPDAFKGEAEPDYLLGYRAVYSLDGELALEEGQWFLDKDKDEFCQKHFEAMLKAIGKE